MNTQHWGWTKYPKISAASPHRARRDADLADIGGRLECIEDINAIHQQSASTVDDGVNTVEASEERLAAFEAQSMR